MNENNIIVKAIESIENEKARSAWARGVKVYALELIEELHNNIISGYFDPSDLASPSMINSALLNGASTWDMYSWGGCSLIYNGDIAERLCSPSEFKKTNGGDRRPNSQEEWLDTQARALYQAANMVKRHIRSALK